MMRATVGGLSAVLLAIVATSPVAHAQTARFRPAPGVLPIAQGVWVKLETACAAATNVFAHGGNRFGSVYFYGPNQSMGPANETEVLTRASRSTQGFTMVNEGPLEVAPRPGGQAAVRAFSPTQGVTWIETVRLCPAATLPPKMRAAIARLGLAATP